VDVLKRHVRAVGIRKYNVTLHPERGKEGRDGEGGPVAMSDRNESKSENKNESDVEGRKKKQTWAAVEDTTNSSSNDSSTYRKKEDVERAKTNNGEESVKRSHHSGGSDNSARKERQEKRNTPSKMLMTFLRTSLANLKEGSGDATNRLDRSPSSGGSSDEAASPLSGSPSSSGRRRSTLSLGRKSGSMYAPSRSAPLPAVEERQRSQSVARQDHGDGTTGSATTSLPGSPQRAAVKKEATRRKAKSEDDDEWKNVFGAEKVKTGEAKNEGEKRKQKNEDDKSEAKETSDLAASKTQVVTSPRHRKKKEEEKEEADSHTKPTKKNKKAKKEN
jgi:hypothetical protein